MVVVVIVFNYRSESFATASSPVDAQGAQSQSLQLDEASCILLVVEPTVILKGGNLLIIQAVLRLAAHNNSVALHMRCTLITLGAST